MQEGVLSASDFVVAQRGAGANMSVDVSAGSCFVQGDSVNRQGLYFVANDATVNVAIPTANGSNPRIDQIVVHVYDTTAIGGATNAAILEVVQGVATPSASLLNRFGAAAIPATALKIADVLVPTSAASIVTANIGNLRDPRAGSTGYPAVTSTLSIAGAPPQFAMGRPIGYNPSARAITATVGSAYLSLATATWVTVTLDGESYDPDAMHDTVTNNSRLTCKTPGLYSIKGEVEHASNADTALRGLRLQLNGATVIETDYRAMISGSDLGQQVSCDYRLGYGDYVELQALQSSGGTLGTAIQRKADYTPQLAAAWQAP